MHVEAEGLDSARWYWYQFRAGDQLSPIGRTRTLPREGASTSRLPLRLRLVPELRDRLLHRIPARGSRRARRGLPSGRLHLRGRGIARSPPVACGSPSSSHWTITGPGTPSIRPTRTCRRRTPRFHGSSRGTIMKCRTTTQAPSHRITIRRKCFSRDGPRRIRRTTSTCRSGRPRRGRPCDCIAGSPSARSRRSSCSTRDMYRTDQPCGDGSQTPCPGVFDPAATMLGVNQERWLLRGLAGSRARWNVLPQQVMMAPVDRAPGQDRRYAMDQWGGYDAERTRLMEFFGARRTSNPVVLTGDSHSNWVNDLHSQRHRSQIAGRRDRIRRHIDHVRG